MTSNHVKNVGRSAWWRWGLFCALLLAIYLAAWPVIWRLVLAPNGSAGPQGLRAEVSAMAAPHGLRLQSLLASPTDLRLAQPHTRAQAQAVWQVPASGLYALRVEADDYARLYLDRRLLIYQPEMVSDHNVAEGQVFLEAGPHFLMADLINLEGQGWLRLLVRPPGQQVWQELPLAQLRPVDLGNLDFWLGLVDWLEGLTLWGLWGALLALPLLFWAGQAGSGGGRARRGLRGLVLIFMGLPFILALARRWPAELHIPYLTTYSPDLRLQVLGLLSYALIITVAASVQEGPWRRRLAWGGLLLMLLGVRIYAWPYSMYCGLHADWTSFAGYYDKFYKFFLDQHLDCQLDLPSLLAYVEQVARGFYVGYPSGCFSFPAILLGLGGLAAQTALQGTGATQGFPLAGHLLGPAFNLAYALLLAALARRHLAAPGQAAWSWALILLLCWLPTHIYLGANITYNLLADALHLALLLTILDLMQVWQGLLEAAEQAGEAPRLPRRLWGLGALSSLLLGLCLATKIVFIPALLTLVAYTVALMIRHRRCQPALVWGRFPGFILALLAGGGLVYTLLIIRNVLNVPGFWGQLLRMTGDNTGLSVAKVGLDQCLRIFFLDLLVPNLGYAGTLAGTLGLALLSWRAWRSRELYRLMVVVWALLTVAFNLLSGSMLLMFNAMPRSSMVMGLWLALALYLVMSLGQTLGAGLGRRGQAWLRAGLAGAVGLETILAGASLLVLYGADAPRHQTEAFLRGLAGSGQSVAAVMYLGYGDDPNTVLGRQVPFYDLRRQARDMGQEEGRRRLLAQTPADYWLLTNFEGFSLPGGQACLQELQGDLAQGGYRLARRLQTRPLARHPWLEALYGHFVGPLLAGPRQGGLQESGYVDIYQRGP